MFEWIFAISFGFNALLALGIWEMKSQQKLDNENLDARLRQLVYMKEKYDKEKARTRKLGDLLKESADLDRQALCTDWIRHMKWEPLKVGEQLAFVAMKERMSGRYYKLKEEMDEAKTALFRGDLMGFIDAMEDIAFTAICAGPLLGYDSNKAFKAVYDSNMTKDPYKFMQDGKGKGADFREPDFTEALGRKL